MSTFIEAETVFVTGASGFVASHVIAQLFEKGYNIIGSVRSDSKGQYLVDRYPGFKYEIVDINSESDFDKVFKSHPEIKYVLHLASPLGLVDDDPKTMVRVAVNGVKTLLKAAQSHGKNVSKIVYTSSIAAAFNGTAKFSAESEVDPSTLSTRVPVSESTWNQLNIEDVKTEGDAYYASKALAEKYLWEFAKTQNPTFKLASILFPIAMGPAIHQGITYDNVNVSLGFLREALVLPSNAKKIPGGYYHHVDVRDVARLHISAMENDRFNGERSFIFSGVNSNQQFVDLLHKFRPEQAKDLPIGTPGEYDESQQILCPTNFETMKRIDFELIPTAKTVLDQFDMMTQLKNKRV